MEDLMARHLSIHNQRSKQMTGKTVEILLQGQVIAQFDESNTKKLLQKKPSQ